MEQLLVRALLEVANGSLGNAILEMRVYPTKGELLSCVVTCLAECVVKKNTRCHNGSGGFSPHALQHTVQRQSWQSLFPLMMYWVGDGRNAGS